MQNPEYQPLERLPQIDWARDNFNQRMGSLFRKLQSINQPNRIFHNQGSFRPDGIKIEPELESVRFRAQVSRKVFEANGVKKEIYDHLFRRRSSREFLIDILKLNPYDPEIIIKLTDRRNPEVSLSCGSNGGRVEELFWMFLFSAPGIFPWNKKKTSNKVYNVKGVDCIAIAGAIEDIARQERLIK